MFNIQNRVFLYIIGIFCSWLAVAYVDSWIQQRWKFKEAQQALEQGDLAKFKKQVKELKDYPTVHYLNYNYLMAHLAEMDAETIQTFLDKHRENPPAISLRQAWLTHLAKKAEWETFLAFYTPQEDITLQCYSLQARIHAQHPVEDMLETMKQLWLVGKLQPAVCDPVFVYMEEKGVITEELRWQRMRLAITDSNFDLADQLAKKLPEEQQKWAKLWLQMPKKPEQALKDYKHPDTPIIREILLYGLKQLARQNAESAHNYWNQYRKKYQFTAQESGEIFRHIALKSADQNHPKAAEWLASIGKDFIDNQVRQVRLQLALKRTEWSEIIDLTQVLDAKEQQKPQWRYWQARALENLEKSKEAQKILEELAKMRDFYGFLAADKLGAPYQFQLKPIRIDQSERDKLLNHQGIVRSRELYMTEMFDFARQEWELAVKDLDAKQLQTAAMLAHEWGWHYQAIVTTAKAGVYDDLNVRFPLAFYDNILTQAEQLNLDYAWVFAVIRQESAFQTKAISPSGALGLMQLMPATAKEVAQRLKIKLKGQEDIIDPAINVQLGTAYLRHLLDRFDNNRLLATAAYNAGPSRAIDWAKEYGCMPLDVWVELIPFSQTRDYVQRVMSYTPIFEFRLIGHEEVEPMPLDKISGVKCKTQTVKK